MVNKLDIAANARMILPQIHRWYCRRCTDEFATDALMNLPQMICHRYTDEIYADVRILFNNTDNDLCPGIVR